MTKILGPLSSGNSGNIIQKSLNIISGDRALIGLYYSFKRVQKGKCQYAGKNAIKKKEYIPTFWTLHDFFAQNQYHKLVHFPVSHLDFVSRKRVEWKSRIMNWISRIFPDRLNDLMSNRCILQSGDQWTFFNLLKSWSQGLTHSKYHSKRF